MIRGMTDAGSGTPMGEGITWQAWATRFEVGGVPAGAFTALLPPPLAAKRWQPGTPVREAAFLLHTELVSRIVTQELHFRTGDEATALKSVYELFPETRRLVASGGADTADFAAFAIGVLNRHVRWFTAKWHGRKERGAFRIEDERHAFRADLAAIQPLLRGFEKALWSLALGDATNTAGADVCAGRGERAEFAARWTAPQVLLGMGDREDEGRQVLAAEHAHLRAAGGQPGEAFGVALSGGGIRSATVCLGVLEVLARRGVLDRTDYLSTVSGGGYTGAFWSWLVHREGDRCVDLAEQLRDEVPKLRRRCNDHLWGAEPLVGRARGLMTLLGGLAAQGLGLVFFVGVAAVVTVALRIHTIPGLVRGAGFLAAGLAAVTLLGAAVLPGWRMRRVAVLGLAPLALWSSLGLVGWLYRAGGDAVGRLGWTTVVAIGLVAVWLVAVRWRFSFLAKLVGRIAVYLAVPVLIGLLYFAFLEALGHPQGGIGFASTVALLVAATVVVLFADANQTSPHAFYRRQLADTYVPGAGLTFDVLRRAQRRPYQLSNCTVNLPASRRPELRGRGSDIFVMAPLRSGSRATGFEATADYEGCDPQFDVATAMAVSGAAASPQMGMFTQAGLVPLMTLLNLRLGRWLLRPGQSAALGGWLDLRYVVREALGKIDESLPAWHLSDGGHIENLGIQELMRRKCRFILAVDAECDEAFALSGLAQALRQAEVDLGVKVEMDLSELQPDDDGLVRAHFQMGRVTYPDGDVGYLLYLKSSLTGDETRAIREYRKRCPSFPHQSTGDQFFDEEQFEMYRQLGEHMAGGLFRRGLVPADIAKDPEKRVDFDSWWRSLVGNLLPPEAPVVSGTYAHPDRVAQCQ